MVVIGIKVENSTLIKVNTVPLVSSSINYVRLQCVFNSDWDGLIKTYQFTNDDISINITSNDPIIIIPHEVLIIGILHIKIWGEEVDFNTNIIKEKITTNPISYNIINSEITDNVSNSSDVTASDIEQVKSIANLANTKSDNTLLIVNDIKSQTDSLLAVKDDTIAIKDETEQIKINTQSIYEQTEISETNAKTSEINSKTSENITTQAMSDTLAMIGNDICPLVNGQIPISKIPLVVMHDCVQISNVNELTTCIAQNGDIAYIITLDTGGNKKILTSYQLLANDSTIRSNWAEVDTSYATQAGYASTAGEATNSTMINNKRIVGMTSDQYANAVKDADTFYFVGE